VPVCCRETPAGKAAVTFQSMGRAAPLVWPSCHGQAGSAGGRPRAPARVPHGRRWCASRRNQRPTSFERAAGKVGRLFRNSLSCRAAVAKVQQKRQSGPGPFHVWSIFVQRRRVNKLGWKRKFGSCARETSSAGLVDSPGINSHLLW
jgi:hypothetical protein